MSVPAPKKDVAADAPEPKVPAALEEIVSQYEMPLLRYVSQLLRPNGHGEAEDLVQETFLRYHRQVTGEGADSIKNPSTWLFRVAHNLVMDTIRKRRRHDKFEAAQEKPEAPQTDALEEMMHREACEQALAELQQLPEKNREVLLLRVVNGMKLRGISEITGLTVGNASYRISEGLQELARRLKANGVI